MDTTSTNLSPRPSRLQRLLSAVLIVALIASCAPQPTKPSVDGALRGKLGKVGVTELITPPQCEADVGKTGSGEKTAKGGAHGALGGAGAGLSVLGACGDPYLCGVVVLLLPAFIVGGAVIGAAAGAASSQPHPDAEDLSKMLEQGVTRTGGSAALRKEVIQAAHRLGIADIADVSEKISNSDASPPDYRSRADTGVDTILEIGLVRVGLVGKGGRDPALEVGEEVIVRLIDVKTNSTVCSDLQFHHFSEPRPLSAWRDQRNLDEELQKGYRVLAANIAEAVFGAEGK